MSGRTQKQELVANKQTKRKIKTKTEKRPVSKNEKLTTTLSSTSYVSQLDTFLSSYEKRYGLEEMTLSDRSTDWFKKSNQSYNDCHKLLNTFEKTTVEEKRRLAAALARSSNLMVNFMEVLDTNLPFPETSALISSKNKKKLVTKTSGKLSKMIGCHPVLKPEENSNKLQKKSAKDRQHDNCPLNFEPEGHCQDCQDSVWDWMEKCEICSDESKQHFEKHFSSLDFHPIDEKPLGKEKPTPKTSSSKDTPRSTNTDELLSIRIPLPPSSCRFPKEMKEKERNFTTT